jgi:hypothetical protein
MLRLHVHSSQKFGLNLLLAFATVMPPKPPWRHEMQDVQESRGRASRNNRSVRRAADAAVQQQREEWCQAGQLSSGPSQQSMQPGSQRWRKLKELEANVDKRNELLNMQAGQQHQQFLLRQQSWQHEEEQVAKLKNVLYQQQVMLTQQTQFLHGYAWTVQSKEMLFEDAEHLVVVDCSCAAHARTSTSAEHFFAECKSKTCAAKSRTSISADHFFVDYSGHTSWCRSRRSPS